MNSQDVILGMLMQRPLSGYDIKQRLETQVAYFFDAGYGTIYPMLNKMEKGGLITKETVVQQGRPNKNVYTITEQGKEQFMTYLSSPMEEDTFKSDFLMRLFFGGFTTNETIIDWIEEEIQRIQKLTTALHNDLERYLPVLSPSQKLCISIGIELNEARLQTLERGLEQFKQMDS